MANIDLSVSINTENRIDLNFPSSHLHNMNMLACCIPVLTSIKSVFTFAGAPSVDCNVATSFFAVVHLRREAAGRCHVHGNSCPKLAA